MKGQIMKKQTTKTSTRKTKAKTTEVVESQVVETTQDNQDSQPSLKVDVEYLKTTNTHFVVHCPSGNISENTFISFVKFGNVARQLGIEWSVETTVNETVSSRAKNMLAAKFLTLAEKTHILFVDPEISFEPWHVLVMLDRKLDIVSGLYPTRTLPIRWAVSTFDGAEENEDGLHEVDRVGTGFLLVKRDVFEKLQEHQHVVNYKNDVGLGEDFDKHLYTYFNSQIVDERYASEDAVFSAIWRSFGNKIWVDKRVLLAHKGQFNYSAAAQDILLSSFGSIYLEYMKNNGKIQVLEEEKAE
jgi:hypothetical protein